MGRVFPDHTIIYALCEPDTGEVRYVGKTVIKLSHRLHKHISCKANRPVANWCRKRVREGRRPQIVAIDVVPNDAWVAAESEWIAHYRARAGDRIMNLTDGGEGTLGWVPTETWYANRTRVLTGKRPSAETRAKMSEAQRIVRQDPEFHQRVSDGIKRRWADPEYKAAMCEKQRITQSNPDLRKAKSEKQKGRIFSDEHRAKISAARKGHEVSEETRRKIAASLTGRKRTAIGDVTSVEA
jgi:hypothetical protein